MARLAISVLGMPRIEMGGTPLAVDRRKAVALLVYLALSDSARGRDTLATLLWPGYDQATARGNLRRTLSVLHTALREAWLLIDRDTVALRRDGDLWVDVQQFERLLDECRTHGHAGDQVCARCLEPLTQAVALYRDDFLTGFTLADAPDFDDWQRDQTEHLRGMLSDALARLVDCLVGQGDYGAAAAQVRRRVALDPLDEAAQRQSMQIHAWAGDRSAALRQYQICTELLRRELKTAPAPETTALYEVISQNRLAPPEVSVGALPTTHATADRERSAAPAPVEGLAASDQRSSGELRPVTILCAGLAGEVDSEAAAAGVERLLAALETILGRYEARIDRLLGDSVVAVFGARQVHEDDAERAIAAACALLPAALALIEATRTHSGVVGQSAGISVGVVTGEAYFGPVGRGGQATHSVLGPLVNRAARLQARAVTGQVLADRATQRQTHQAFHYGALHSEGSSEQTQIYAVEGSHSRAAKTRGIEGLRAELIGRDEELAKLEAALARVRAGQGQMVALISEAGLGKSRLVAELKARGGPAESATPSQSGGQSAIATPHSAIVWLEGRCLEMTSSTSYGPFVDLLHAHFAPTDAVRGEPPALAVAIRAELKALRDAGNLTAEQVEEIGPLLGNLLSVSFGDDWDERLRMADPGQIRHRTFAALRDFFGTLAQQPTVLVLEDLHWADSLSVDLIGELMGLLADHPLLLLCVYRPGLEYASERLAAVAARRCADRYSELRLHPLTADESRRLLASLLTVEGLPTQARELIVAQGEGNPFFTEEIVRGLIDASLLYRDGGTWRARERIEVARAPEGVQSVILSRVDRLAAGDKQVLQIASVLGRLFRLSVLSRLAPPELDVGAALERLTERDFVYLERMWPEVEYSFKHVLTQEAVYGTLLAGRKTQLHRQAGEAIEAIYADSLTEHTEALAHHYDRGDANDKAIEYLLKAGEKARRAYLNDEAIGYCERTLARCEHAQHSVGQDEGCAASRLEAMTGLGKVHFLVGRFVEAEGWLRQAISLGRELGLAPDRLARLYFWLGDALFWQDRWLEMVALGKEGLELLEGDRESAEAAFMNALIATSSVWLGYHEQARESALRIARFLDRLPYEEELRPAFSAVANFYTEFEKRPEEAKRWLQILETHGKRYHDLRAVAWATGHRGAIMQRTGDCREAVSLLREAVDLCRQIGDVATGIAMLHWLWEACLSFGDLEEAEYWCRKGFEDWLTMDKVAAATAGEVFTFAGVVMLCKGDHEGALQASRESLEYYPTIPPDFRPAAIEWRARAHHGAGQRAKALSWYQKALVDTKPEDMRVFWVPWHVWRPRFWIILSGLEEACNDAAAFRAICQRYRDEHPADAATSVLQWHLEPSSAGAIIQPLRYAMDFRYDALEGFQSLGWTWQDPFDDCSWECHVTNGLIIRAANGRDLFFLNRSAPRLLRAMSGDFMAETICAPALDDRPGSGGLLLWKDEDNYLLLDRGRGGLYEICLEGCVGRQDTVFGRGRLPAERVFLRLERRGERVDALCSADGETWWSVGHAAFPADGTVQIGLCAIGMIDRTIYPGAYREGTAIRFESFRMW